MINPIDHTSLYKLLKQMKEKKYLPWYKDWAVILVIVLAFAFGFGIMFECCGEDIDISAIIQIESGGDPNAYNKRSGCIGLMQINPKGALVDYNNATKIVKAIGIPDLTIGDLYNPTINVEIGTWYIKEQLTKYLKYYKIPLTVDNYLIGYHDGIGNLRKYLAGKRKLGPEMKSYIKKYHRLTDKK